MSTRRSVRSRSAAVALTSAIVMAIAGCEVIPVTSDSGVLTATVGTNNAVYWFFFNQDFKDFAGVRPPRGVLATDVYYDAIASHPGSKYIKIEQNIDGFSEVSGSGASRQVLLKANEFANQGDGRTLSATEDIVLDGPAYGFTWLSGAHNTRVTTIVPSDLCGLFVMATADDDAREDRAFYDDIVATTDTYDCSDITPVSNQGGDEKPAGPPGIFLTVAGPVGRSASEAPVYYGADRIQPNSIYTLSIQSVTNLALTRIILDSGSVNSRGHLYERVLLPEMNPGSYKIAMTGIHASGNLLVLTNFITIGANGGIVSVSPESQQPFLK